MNFNQRTSLVCREIPEGTVATYGQIALLCGKPKNARQVGHVLNRGLAGNIPAHRVVNAKGILSGAASFETPDLQKQMLEQEGVQVIWTIKGWQVNLKQVLWKNTMEDALRLEQEFQHLNI